MDQVINSYGFFSSGASGEHRPHVQFESREDTQDLGWKVPPDFFDKLRKASGRQN
jgi:hypothetical protein